MYTDGDNFISHSRSKAEVKPCSVRNLTAEKVFELQDIYSSPQPDRFCSKTQKLCQVPVVLFCRGP